MARKQIKKMMNLWQTRGLIPADDQPGPTKAHSKAVTDYENGEYLRQQEAWIKAGRPSWYGPAQNAMNKAELCGTPSHPASACSVSAPPPRTPHSLLSSSRNASDFNRLSPTAPPPPIFPSPANKRSSANAPVSKGVDKHGRPILYQGGRMFLGPG
ncbi:hypothetical protein F7725_002796 [Dissostichus mawsoni]|uniref:Uncharacterized protein n=1 Tax=Dissostichus mawsoni TaxID=36200 RepID=A0A7J5YBK2_DISMA|nr:hypothetical protein F7725_002796 [Dissostichus mawsoni]